MNSAIAIILVEPETPDNIGAVARAMKNMGLSDLRLVKPPADWLKKAKKMAMSAFDTLKDASVFSSLEDAVSDRKLIIGTTRRDGAKRGEFLPFDKTIALLTKAASKSAPAVLFGKESKGLANEDLALCDWMVTIPSHPDYLSINLAQAVMIVAFSLFTHKKKKAKLPPAAEISKKDFKEVMGRFETALRALDYERDGNDVIDRILATFSRMTRRAGLLEHEAQMLRGLTRRISERMKLVRTKS